MKRSEQINELIKALAQFHSEVEQPKKDADNPFFKSKYVPLENIISVTEKPLAKYGLAVMQWATTDIDEDRKLLVNIYTSLAHSSGQYIDYDPLTLYPQKADPQGIGSTITYGKRYAYSSILGIASDVDDDGNEASGLVEKQNSTSKPTAKKATAEQVKLLATYPTERLEKALEFYKVNELKDLTVVQASQILTKFKKEESEDK